MASKGWDKQVVIGEIQKSAGTLLRVSYVEAEPQEDGEEKFKAVSINELYKRKGDTEWKYSQKNMVVSMEHFSDFKRLVTEAGIEATKAENVEEKKTAKKPRRKAQK